MTDAELIADARVRQLTDLTTRLTDRLTEESRAFEARRPQDAAGTLADTQEMANLYRRETAQVKANPSCIAEAPREARLKLMQSTEAFEAVLARHARAVEAARIVSEGLVKTIAAEVAAQRGNPSAYGSSGHATNGDGRAVAFNQTA